MFMYVVKKTAGIYGVNCSEWPHLDGVGVPYGSVCRENEHAAFLELDLCSQGFVA